eukprot:Unigene17_Nuclearia_a/m.94 Unigene17_Nuclearia_a/g.94  ORF Unigene17_Nuclearia_a/g.94 Unigene17_Nuclearia_a/m.94 type:complete len:108 (+) Unigene17_Nuclearia_a:464-787(+)
MEKAAMEEMCAHLGPLPAAREIVELFCEYEDGATAEARVVKDLDKFEMIVQAYEYERSDGIRLDSFFESTAGRFTHPEVQGWVSSLYARRAALHAGGERRYRAREAQ